MLDQRKIESPDVPQTNRPRLFFHGTQIPHAPQLMHEYGLMSDKPTLSPTLEIVEHFVGPMGGGFLTFWYPRPGEISKKHHRIARLTTPLPEELRQRALKEILSSDLDDFYKNAYLRIVQRAEIYLPASRLGAAAQPKVYDVMDLGLLLSPPPDTREVIKIYTMMKKTLNQDVLEILKNMNIVFFFPDLDRQQLAQDMMRTSVDHALLSIGQHVQIDLEKIKKDLHIDKFAKIIHRENLKFLESVVFEEDNYERYRKSLIATMEKLLQA